MIEIGKGEGYYDLFTWLNPLHPRGDGGGGGADNGEGLFSGDMVA